MDVFGFRCFDAINHFFVTFTRSQFYYMRRLHGLPHTQDLTRSPFKGHEKKLSHYGSRVVEHYVTYRTWKGLIISAMHLHASLREGHALSGSGGRGARGAPEAASCRRTGSAVCTTSLCASFQRERPLNTQIRLPDRTANDKSA